tara:strand:+ start:34413 stop:36563 length:2151 start_codon:yes stop_codon:yes gene_type:complete
MGNTSVNITLQSKSDPTINIQTIDGGSVNSSPNFIPTINFVATGPVGAQGSQGLQGADGSGGSTLTDNSVETSHIINSAVTGSKIANHTISASKLLSSSVSTIKLQNSSVTTEKLADNSVTAAKIANGAITNELIDVFADFAIKKEKIEYLGLDASVIALDAIITSKIKDRNVTGQKICSDPDLDGEVKAHNLKLKGSSPGTLTGPDSDALQIKSNTTIDFLNTTGTTIASLDQSGNLTVSGTVDNRNISTDGSKLDTISNNAQPNVKSNWNETDSNSDAFIQNKPTIPVNTDTTYNIQCVDGDNSNEQKIRLAASGSGSGDDDVVLEAGTGLSISRSGDKITFTNTVVDTDTVLTAEQVQDIVGAMIDGGTETNISVTYDDASGKLNFVSTDTNTTYSVMGPGNSYAAGLVPEGDSSHTGQFLRKDGAWVTPPDTNTTYVEATSQYMGLMSSAHHDKLDGIAEGAEVNVNADWNATSGDAQILNKPTIPAAYTDADAVSAVEAGTIELANDLTVNSNFIYLKDQSGSGAASRFNTATLTANRTLTMPDATGTLALTSNITPTVIGQFSTRVSSYWSGRYYYGHASYGWNYFGWNYATTSKSTLDDRYVHMGMVSPMATDNVKVRATVRNDSNTEDVQLCLLKGPRPNGSSSNISLTELGSVTVTISTVDLHYNGDIDVTDANLAVGDLVFLVVRRISTAANATKYIQVSATIYGE